jgi:hypothetical protein
MKGQQIPDPDHVARYCKPSTIDEGEIQATAFMTRENEEYLSVNWLEELKCSDRGSEIRQLQDLYTSKFSRVPAAARIAILNVGTVRSKVSGESPDQRLLRILHEPLTEPPDSSHAGIYNIRADDEIIAELIKEVVQENHPARCLL